MTSSIRAFFSGATFLFQGWSHLKKHPGLSKFIWIPFLINILILCFGIYLGSQFLGIWVEKVMIIIFSDFHNKWTAWLYYPLLLLFWMGFIILLGYGIFVFGAVISAPFNALLAERSLPASGLLSDTSFRWGAWAKFNLMMLRVSLLKFFIFSVLGIIALVVSLIPGVGLLASVVTSLVVAFDCMDYSFEARGWGLRKRFSYFRQKFPMFVGMALTLTLTLLVPGLTLLLYPLAVLGASQLMASIE
ncbi:MAG: EI24 domain-containing protein [Bdellovibrionales bacterium]|nr:EI24 domain-containing protein [Bdellovibrionales bacterium]